MADEQNKGYEDKKEFVCTACKKKIMLTKFASQKNCRCDECKENDIPVNPDIVAEVLAKNPPKERKGSTQSTGNTKICKCIKCGKDAEVSKFMSADKAMCDDCKGTTPKEPKGLVQRITPDMSKLDRSRLLPIEEYEVNDVNIKNPKLRSVKCPACGHEFMKQIMVIDWSQFGLIIKYQCPKCLLTALLSEQCDRMTRQHSPGTRFDYTGNEIKELGASPIEESRHVNVIRKLIQTLDENNIKIDDGEIVKYRWKNEKPVDIGFEVPDSDKFLEKIEGILNILDKTERQGSGVDMPVGSRYITIPHTVATKLSKDLKDALKGDSNGINTKGKPSTD